MLLNGLGRGNRDVGLAVSSSVMLCSMPIISCGGLISCGGRSAMLLDEEEDDGVPRRGCCATTSPCDVGSGCERWSLLDVVK